jgi:carbon storage regulator
MLVLTRKTGESIVIGDVVIHIGDLRRGRVRIGVDAPSGVSILRGELIHPLDDDSDLASKPAEWSHVPIMATRLMALHT